ncbi:MAG TPA: ATPase domain-containing protein, partial [Myxococcaceae bacterium]|nr:ATPase domain-containing protein [Myxococcaceae bacterium]
AQRVGLDVEPLVQNGSLRIEYPLQVESDGDEVAAELLEQIAKERFQRVVLDGTPYLEGAVLPAGRIRSYFLALVSLLRSAGVTSLFTKQISKVIGPELDFSDTPLAAIAENLLFLRHVELEGRLHRVLSILNLRDSIFDPSVREFVVTNGGLRVLEPFRSAAGLLTGQARPLSAVNGSGGAS